MGGSQVVRVRLAIRSHGRKRAGDGQRDALAAAHSRALEKVSRDIAAVIRAEADAK
jgi:hypothetical protein